jgi:hypothetical protein
MLRLGPLVVYPVEVTSLRGQRAPAADDSRCEMPRHSAMRAKTLGIMN